MKSALLFTILLFIAAATANAAVVKSTRQFSLGETEIRVNLYENPGRNITFFAPHHNEQTGLNIAKEYVANKGGRLIEIESFDDKGKPARYVKFTFNGKTYSLDPNRIFTANGRRCNLPVEIEPLVKDFADKLLRVIFAEDGNTLREGEQFIVAVHNNADVSAKTTTLQPSDLTAVAFIKAQSTKNLAHGAFEAQAEGVYLSNTETDEDNFIFLSAPRYVGHFAELGFNVVVQKSANKLFSEQCTVDDGSLSVFSAQNKIQYICLEADGITGGFRQRQMLEAVYALLPEQKPVEPATVASTQ